MARTPRPTSRTFGDKPLAAISDDELRALVSKHIAERQHLDFKLEFNHTLPEAVPKLLRHVASFANGGGGYLVLGIRDDGHGRAQRFEGLQGNVETAVRRIRDLCVKHLSPASAASKSTTGRSMATLWCSSGSHGARGFRT
jgi:Putative DNA-binding domain